MARISADRSLRTSLILASVTIAAVALLIAMSLLYLSYRHEASARLVQQAEVETRIARVANAPLGEPFLLRVVQGAVELAVGDDFLEKMGTEVLLENGRVISITSSRTGQQPAEEQNASEEEAHEPEPVAS